MGVKKRSPMTYVKVFLIIGIAMSLQGCITNNAAPQKNLGLGKPISEAQIHAWNIDIAPNGAGLPSGNGNAIQGKIIYQNKCASCHGADGEGGLANKLVGGGSLNTPTAVKTIGSYWPYSTTIFDYIRRAMPYGAAQSLSNGEVYSLTAYLLNANQIIGPETVMDAQSLSLVKMPNQSGFIPIEK